MKIKIEIKSWLTGSILFEYECENNTTAKTVKEAVKSSADLRFADLRFADLRFADLRFADLSSANLSSANLSSANLRSANLSSADLRFADLRFADLSSANLSSANLRSANLSSVNLSSRITLSEAKTDKRYIQIGCIGSSKRMTTYCFEDDIVWCGCFKGTLEEFENTCKRTHKNNEQYLKEYMGAINYIKLLK